MIYVAIASLWVSVLGIGLALATGFELFDSYQPVRLHVWVSLAAGVFSMGSLILAMIRLTPKARKKSFATIAFAGITLGAVFVTGFLLKSGGAVDTFHAWVSYLSFVVVVHVATRLSFALWSGASNEERETDPT